VNIVITGASRGIGRVLANNIAASRMFLLYRADDEGMKLTVAGVRCPVSVFKCDVSSEAQVKDTFDRIEQVDVLINNAGTTADTLVKNMSEEQWDRVMDVNLKGAFLCSKYAMPRMKSGVESFTRSLARELIRDGIFVNCISLGFFEVGLGAALSPKVREAALRQIPTQRFGDPQEVVRAVEFIIGSKYLVGSSIDLYGGL
jgi:3-oxoacyl-[acyl-carrier protein] reductase